MPDVQMIRVVEGWCYICCSERITRGKFLKLLSLDTDTIIDEVFVCAECIDNDPSALAVYEIDRKQRKQED